MVTAEEVWDALAEIPDPEIPVVSLVDLGVVRSVDVRDETARIEFTPTFLGCPALELMRDAIAEKVRTLGAEPDIEVVLDDSWSTDKITPAGREKRYRGDEDQLARAVAQLTSVGAAWDARLQRIKRIAEAIQRGV